MREIYDGGPAFPSETEFQDGKDTILHFETGMSLRDYFAAKAMQALYNGVEMLPRQRAAIAYEMADAMLIARLKGGNQ